MEQLDKLLGTLDVAHFYCVESLKLEQTPRTRANLEREKARLEKEIAKVNRVAEILKRRAA